MSIDAVNSTQSETYASPPITIIVTVILLIFFFVGFFSIYFCRCFIEAMSNSLHLQRSPSGNHVGPSASNLLPGLDPSIIESFPKFVYSTVKHYRKGENYGLECAICISEFADDDLLRLLTFCCHVFHQDCIDLWLKSHKTCPVCRKNLDAAPGDSPLKCPMMCNNSRHIGGTNENGENSMAADSISIAINDVDDDECKRRNEAENGVGPAALVTVENVEDNTNGEERFSKSHSTGHSIARIRGNDEDRYTLRLPEDVQSRITRGHHWTKSCTAIGDYSNSSNTNATAKHGGFGEVSGVSGGNDNKV